MLKAQTIQTQINVAKVCGNCVHINGFCKLRGRLLNMLKALETDSIRSPILTPNIVATIQNIVTSPEWTCECKEERASVRMFDEACAKWNPPATGTAREN